MKKRSVVVLAMIVAPWVVLGAVKLINYDPCPHTHPDYEQRKVHEIVNDADHEDKVHIKGHITDQVTDDTYAFRDEHGKTIHVRIHEDNVPDQGVQFHSPITLHGEVQKVGDQPVHVEADQIHYFF